MIFTVYNTATKDMIDHFFHFAQKSVSFFIYKSFCGSSPAVYTVDVAIKCVTHSVVVLLARIA